MSFDTFIDTLETVAAKRAGTYGQKTQVLDVVSPDAIGPRTFAKILIGQFNVTQEQILTVDFQDGRISLLELYTALTSIVGSPAT